MQTEETVKQQLSRLLNEVSAVREATNRLTAKLGSFSNKAQEDAYLKKLRGADFSFPVKYATDEPKSHIRDAIYEFGGQSDLSDATRTLIAISRSLDGALQDIRASRIFLDTISKDADGSALFREWQSRQGGD